MIPLAFSAVWTALVAVLRSSIGRLLVVAAVALSVGFWQGWSLRGRLDESAALRATVDKLEREARARDAAAHVDQVQAGIDAADRRALQERIDALLNAPAPAAPSGDGLTARDADGVRALWGR